MDRNTTSFLRARVAAGISWAQYEGLTTLDLLIINAAISGRFAVNVPVKLVEGKVKQLEKENGYHVVIEPGESTAYISWAGFEEERWSR